MPCLELLRFCSEMKVDTYVRVPENELMFFNKSMLPFSVESVVCILLPKEY